jgi:hypothetical protein
MKKKPSKLKLAAADREAALNAWMADVEAILEAIHPRDEHSGKLVAELQTQGREIRGE